MRSEFPGVFAAEREWVGWINAARDHAHESFIFLRFRPRHLFKFEDFGSAILVRDDRFHHRCFGGACSVRG